MDMNSLQRIVFEAYTEGWRDGSTPNSKDNFHELQEDWDNSKTAENLQANSQPEMIDNEVYMALLGGRIGRYWWGLGHWGTEGQPAKVDFDWKLIYEREKTYGDVVGFWHTHPHFPATPSGVDYRAMAGWTVAFGRPLVCCIQGIDGLKAHWFEDDEHEHVTTEVQRVGDLFFGIDPYLR